MRYIIGLFCIILTCLSVICPTFCSAKTIGVVGQTYSITEKDALSEMQERANNVDWSKTLDKKKAEKQVKNYKPKNLKSLPRAVADKVYSVDMTYTLDMDIKDANGSLVYPKGYTFNPLQYVSLPNNLVFINGDDKLQIEWFMSSEYAKDINTMLMLTDGNYYNVNKKLKIPVYYATSDMLDRFGIRAVPSVARQSGDVMEVRQFDVQKKKTTASSR